MVSATVSATMPATASAMAFAAAMVTVSGTVSETASAKRLEIVSGKLMAVVLAAGTVSAKGLAHS